jgi:hypothetical protein
MIERRSPLDLNAAMSALEGRATSAAPPTDGQTVAEAAGLRPRGGRTKRKASAPKDEAAVTRIRRTRTARVHMFSTRASAETLNALYALARDERRTVTELFEEAVGLLARDRGRGRSG